MAYICMACKKPISDEPMFSKRNEGDGFVWVFNGEYAFHYHDTHGIPPEAFIDLFQEWRSSRKERIKAMLARHPNQQVKEGECDGQA